LLQSGTIIFYFDRTNLPDIGPFDRFEFPTIGHVYDANDHPLARVAKQYRRITKYEDIPPTARDAILAAEDKNFFSHSGVDYSIIPRVLYRIGEGKAMKEIAKELHVSANSGTNSR
jgi:penicillin-binding protein 1A